MRTLLRAAVVAAIGVLALAGCGSGSNTDSDSASAAIDPSGAWGQSDPGQPNLVLDSDGSFTGTDGCNQMGGSWAADGAEVTFSDVRQTLMACQDVDTWLSALVTATATSDSLTVFDENGAEIGSLDRG